jgi:hypothetical protein
VNVSALRWPLCQWQNTRIAEESGSEFTMISNAELDRLIAELRTHPLAEGYERLRKLSSSL